MSCRTKYNIKDMAEKMDLGNNEGNYYCTSSLA